MQPRRPRPNSGGRGQDQGFDASPDPNEGFDDMSGGTGGRGGPNSQSRQGSPRSIQDTQAWQDGKKGIKGAWSQYTSILHKSFERMEPYQREIFVTRMSQAVTIGSAVLALSIFYPFIPTAIRVVLLPLVIVGSWYLGTKVVAPQMMDRFINRK